MKFWRLNLFSLFLLSLFLGKRKIIARGPFAAALALKLRNIGLASRIVFDARGAYTAELNEYDVIRDDSIRKKIKELEEGVLRDSDFRIGVSSALVRYWRETFRYEGLNHVVIPCTLNTFFLKPYPSRDEVARFKSGLGFSAGDLVLVYSGSSAGWQSFSMVTEFLEKLMMQDHRIKLLFLAKEMPPEFLIVPVFNGRVKCQWLKPSEVREALCACDFGLILRERSVTNKVASPVKFAEYLSCGLKILISEEIGDYSEFVKQQACGEVIQDAQRPLQLKIPEYSEKEALARLASEHFSKKVYQNEYKRMLACG